MSQRIPAVERYDAALDELTATAREITELRKQHREFKLAILSALGVTDPWAITTWQQVHYVDAIERLLPKSEVCPHGWLLARGCAVCERFSCDPPESENEALARALVALADELDRNAIAVPPSAERMVSEARAAHRPDGVR